jgi:hypothetical protein
MTEPIESLEDDARDTAEGLLAALDFACQQRDAMEKACRYGAENCKTCLGSGTVPNSPEHKFPEKECPACKPFRDALALLDAPPDSCESVPKGTNDA